MERFDVFVIGGGGTGSEIAFELRAAGTEGGLAERDKLGGECNHYGCVPTKVMLRSAKIASLARDGGRFGVRIPVVDVDFQAVRTRSATSSRSSPARAAPFERVGVRVFLQEARLSGTHRAELADGTQIEADRWSSPPVRRPRSPRSPAWWTVPFWTNREAIWGPASPPSSLAVSAPARSASSSRRSTLASARA